MLPSEYRKRYLLFFILSLLVHISVLVYFAWHPLVVEKKKFDPETTTVEIKLKDKKEEEKKKAEEKKAEEKKAEEKKAEEKKAEEKKAESKKEEPKKEEPKKAEPKKEEPKKEEPRKEEPKKAEPKQEEPKKEEPKKAEPKKEEPKKEEPKKAEPKKEEPKKEEPKKAEPKKEEPKKEEPKKAEPKQEEPKKAEPPKTQKQQLGKSQVDGEVGTSTTNVLSEVKKELVPITLPGSVRVLDEDALKKEIIYVEGDKSVFEKREFRAKEVIENMTVEQKKYHDGAYKNGYNKILAKYKAPERTMLDLGKKYYGEVRFLLDEKGFIRNIELIKPSAHSLLNQRFYEAVKETVQLDLPEDPVARFLFIVAPKLVYFDQTDLADPKEITTEYGSGKN